MAREGLDAASYAQSMHDDCLRCDLHNCGEALSEMHVFVDRFLWYCVLELALFVLVC